MLNNTLATSASYTQPMTTADTKANTAHAPISRLKSEVRDRDLRFESLTVCFAADAGIK